MDFFYVWLRRTLHGLSPEIDKVFQAPLAPKWDHEAQDGELIDDASRFEGDKARSRTAYEEGMFRAFGACRQALKPDGRLVIVFANKQANAWETLVSALIRAGFVVTASWPIQTEMGNRTRALASAALSSSVWLVCQKRPAARPGWDGMVLKEMEEKIVLRLRDFWDAGIRGPDFIWAATGPAMEAYSKHPVVKKANAPAGENLSVSEFLSHVRRLVADFVVGRVLSGNGGTVAVSGLDDVTTYYLLHRHSFGLAEVLAGNCILYALACGLSDVAQEEPVEPVGKEDVAEVLRRRFFTMESIRDKEAFKPHVVAALKGIYDLDPLTKRDKQAAEARFFGSYPFHPDMTDVFYSKWTAMESFQRTRGILRTFALALRDAAKWDESPLVAANVFLESPDKTGIAAATRELSSIATTEEYEGRRQEWTGILEGELAKAREIQAGDGLRFREMEQAVLATFLHSQPIGQKALTRELLVLLGATRPDKITLEKALQQWADISWFLDDEAIQDAETGPDGKKLLPKSWKLGSKPNLRHHFCPAKRY
ncbi:MAG: DUF499 domain-containing protein [Deltaproteobacteria bacterium]|nr:DUF499 domain-containing protein [Deltaproteobacteria bacterium]